MRVLLQRVVSASVEVESRIVGQIGKGFLLLVGLEEDDTENDLSWMAGKVARLRVFSDHEQKMNLSLLDIQGELLAVSQFTLFASYKKGNRPSFSGAARPEKANVLFRRFVTELEALLQRPVATGVFGADMQVQLINDGPVTIFLDSRRPE